MDRFRNILVSITGEPSRQALLDRAARLAKQNKARITLAAVVDDLPWYTRLVLPSAEESNRTLVREQSEALEALAVRLRQDGLDVTTKVLKGRPSLELIQEVLKGGHDLVLKTAEPNRGVHFGPADLQLLRDCPCPVWVFNPEHLERPFTKILAAVDPAPVLDVPDPLRVHDEPAAKNDALDLEILKIANALMASEGAEAHIVHAWSAPGEMMLRGEGRLDQEQVEAYVNDSKEAARKALDQLVSKVPVPPAGRRVTHLLKGDPADVIAEWVKTAHVDLIVMGTVARTGIPGLLIGSTAASILQRVSCSVLAVKPDGFASPVPLAE